MNAGVTVGVGRLAAAILTSVGGVAMAAPPSNDPFAAAADLASANPATVTGTNGEATVEASEPLPLQIGATVWWKWTALEAGEVTVTTAGSDFDTVLAIYSGTTLANLTQLDANDQDGLEDHSRCTAVLAAGQVLWIQAGGYEGETGTLSVGVTLAPPPANDSFASAAAIPSALPQSASGTNVNASTQPGETFPPGTTATVWWKWTAPADTGVRVDRTGSAFKPVLTIYAGNSLDALTKVVSNESNPNSIAVIEFNALAGTQYFIQAGGASGQAVTQGNLTLALTAAPAPLYDNFAAPFAFAAALPRNSPWLNLTGATLEAGEPAPGGFHPGTVWLSWTPAAGGIAELSLVSAAPVRACVYTGTALAALHPVVSQTGGSLYFPFNAGETHMIQISPASAANALVAVTLRAVTPGTNDAFASPVTGITAAATFTNHHNILFTSEAGEPHPAPMGSRTAWYRWTPPASSRAKFYTSAATFDTVLAVYAGNAPGSLTLLGLNDNAPGLAAPTLSQVNLNVDAGTAYYVQVGGNGANTQGYFTLRWNLVPANDDFADAADAGAASGFSVAGSTENSTQQSGEPPPGYGKSVWWKWTAPATGRAWLRMAATPLVVTYLHVFTGSAFNALTEVATINSDNLLNGPPPLLHLTFDTVVGTVYFFRIVSLQDVSVGLDLSMPPPPGNDHFANALDWGSAATASSQVLDAVATPEFSEPLNAGDNTTWWRWTAPASGLVEVNTIGSDHGAVCRAFTGSFPPGGSLTSRAVSTKLFFDGDIDPRHRLFFNGGAGIVYCIQAAGSIYRGAQRGNLTLNLRTHYTPPPHDAFASAATLGSAIGATRQGSNAAAGTEAGEPAGPNSVWWNWTAPASAPVTLDSTGSNFQSRLDVFTGSAVSALTNVASALSTTTTPAALNFNAVQGTTYRLRLAGVSGNDTRGDYVLLLGDAYARWAAEQGLDGTTFPPLLDPDNDGLANLIEFACALNPGTAEVQPILTPGSGTAGLPHVSHTGTGAAVRLRIEYLRRRGTGNPGITVTPQFSSNTAEWQNATGTPVVTAIDAVWERVVVEDTAGAARRFARLHVSRP